MVHAFLYFFRLPNSCSMADNNNNNNNRTNQAMTTCKFTTKEKKIIWGNMEKTWPRAFGFLGKSVVEQQAI